MTNQYSIKRFGVLNALIALFVACAVVSGCTAGFRGGGQIDELAIAIEEGVSAEHLLNHLARTPFDAVLIVEYDDQPPPRQIFVALRLEGELTILCGNEDNLTPMSAVLTGEEESQLGVFFDETLDEGMTRGFWSHSIERRVTVVNARNMSHRSHAIRDYTAYTRNWAGNDMVTITGPVVTPSQRKFALALAQVDELVRRQAVCH